jgi:hypothetical protein
MPGAKGMGEAGSEADYFRRLLDCNLSYGMWSGAVCLAESSIELSIPHINPNLGYSTLCRTVGGGMCLLLE